MARRILIVEDERIVAEDIRKGLEKYGYSVCGIASSGKEALKKAEKTPPDMALVDIVLSGNMDGIETARQMHSRFNIPVVFLTAYDDEKTLTQAKMTEPYGYLLKPFKERELHSTIEMALHKHEMERKAKDSVKWLATTLTSMNHGVITTDVQELVTFLNPVAEELTGWKQEDAAGTPLNDVFQVAAESDEAESPVSHVLQEGTVFNLNHRTLVSRDGTTHPIEETATPLKDDQGTITGAVVVFSDVTNREEMEEGLRESEARYRALFDRTLLCVYVHDLEGRFLDANEAALNLMGYTREEIPQLTIFSILEKEQIPQAMKTLEEIKRNGFQKKPTQCRLKKKDGSTVWVETEGSLMLRHGNPYAIQGIARDITEYKKAEMQLKKLFEASKLINSTMDIEEVFKFISNSVRELVDFDNFIIFLVSKDRKNTYPVYSEGKKSTVERVGSEYGRLVTDRCIEGKETVLLENVKEQGKPGTAEPLSEIMIPLVIEDECVGALYISKVVPYSYHQEDVTILKPLSEVVSSALWNSRLYDEVQELNRELEERIIERSQRMEIILSARQSLQSETSWENGLRTIVVSMSELGFERVGVFLVDPMRKTLDLHIGTGLHHLKAEISVSLKDTEYFGVKCVSEKRTIHVKDSTTVEGKQITADSHSFVWIPIIVHGEAFAALVADKEKSRELVTDEDVQDLEMLAGMCAAFIDRTRILLEPVAEKSLDTELKYKLSSSESYIVTEIKPEKSFEMFVDLVTHGIPGFVISREYPEKIKRKHKLEKTPIVWLSKSQVRVVVDPNDLSKLMYMLEDFTKKSAESVILLDGLEYLITQNSFEAMLKYLHDLKDMVVLNSSLLIIPLHKEALSTREFSILERDHTILESS